MHGSSCRSILFEYQHWEIKKDKRQNKSSQKKKVFDIEKENPKIYGKKLQAIITEMFLYLYYLLNR